MQALAFVVAWCTVVPGYGDVQPQDLTSQRKTFLAAQAAVIAGKSTAFKALLPKLETYPLYGYLLYEDLSRRLSDAKETELRAFLARTTDSPIGSRLRNMWLMQLAQQQRWKLFVTVYEPQDDDELRCYFLRARLATGKIQDLMDDTRRMWLVGREQPAACDPVFEAWRRAKGMTEELVWQRIRLAMEAGKLSLAQTLAMHLKPDGRAWVERWVRVHQTPAKELEPSGIRQDTPIAREIMRYGVLRLLKFDVDVANDRWRALKPLYAFTPEQVNVVEREIALQAAYRQHPRALEWLNALPATDELVVQWRARIALLQGNWIALRAVITALPPADAQQDQWLYWKARALAEIGSAQGESVYDGVVFELFDALVGRRSYYGFLAADRLTREYEFKHASVQFTDADLAQIAQLPGMQRAYELLLLDRTLDARKEWLLTTARFNSRQLQVAAVLAHQWGWHDRAILTMAQSADNDDMDVRFPMAYQDQVAAVSNRYGLDPAWVYGIIRQESAFMLDSRSGVGAMGLMQLMPATASFTAKLIKQPFKGNFELLDVDRNIELGSAYLKHLADQYGGNPVLATAAYNAGPQRVNMWMPAATQAADVWVETVPYRETREYIKRVLTYTTIFDQRLGGPTTRLSLRMPAVKY
ncbi:MAG: transglycosylase SLT domain-containing protein [Gammaproteobacteria bacterium]|nr:transglycosylase SLT domain-containing protein [Gammaproteobacteria bacterium]